MEGMGSGARCAASRLSQSEESRVDEPRQTCYLVAAS